MIIERIVATAIAILLTLFIWGMWWVAIHVWS